MISEKSLCKILKAAYRGGGYTVMPELNDITIYGDTWAVRCEISDLPTAVSVQIVEDAAYLPVEAMRIQKGQPNQLMMREAVEGWKCLLPESGIGAIHMKKIPVIFRDRWQLYQSGKGDVYAFDTELLKLIDFKQVDPTVCVTEDGRLGMFFWGDYAVYIAPGKFSKDNEDKLLYIAGLDWEHQVETGDTVVNTSLFDKDQEAPLMEKEDG